MPSNKLDISALDSDQRIDDRWTESKLTAAGYHYTGDGRCRRCGASVSFYRKDPLDATKPIQWRVLDEGSLGLHQC